MKLVKEHINFQRGLDPKDAMSIGDIKYRNVKKAKEWIYNAINELQDKYELQDITEDQIYPIPTHETLVSFKHSNTRYFILNTIKPLYVGNNFKDAFRVGFWFTQGSKMNHLIEEEAYTISECIETLEKWFKTLEIP